MPWCCPAPPPAQPPRPLQAAAEFMGVPGGGPSILPPGTRMSSAVGGRMSVGGRGKSVPAQSIMKAGVGARHLQACESPRAHGAVAAARPGAWLCQLAWGTGRAAPAQPHVTALQPRPGAGAAPSEAEGAGSGQDNEPFTGASSLGSPDEGSSLGLCSAAEPRRDSPEHGQAALVCGAPPAPPIDSGAAPAPQALPRHSLPPAGPCVACRARGSATHRVKERQQAQHLSHSQLHSAHYTTGETEAPSEQGTCPRSQSGPEA